MSDVLRLLPPTVKDLASRLRALFDELEAVAEKHEENSRQLQGMYAKLWQDVGDIRDERDLLRKELIDAHRVWDEVAVTPSGANRVRGLAALRDEVSACRADNLRLVAENARLRTAIEEAPHSPLCAWLKDAEEPCSCWKGGMP